MPALPFPLGSPLSGGTLTAKTLADINAVLPLLMAPDDPAPVRDAVFKALLAIVLRYQKKSTFSAGQSDILTAIGPALWQCCAEIGVFAQPGESDAALRARALTSPALVTPDAIMAAVNAITAPYTTILARYCEPLVDRWFLYSKNDTSPISLTSPRAYLYKRASVPSSPDYWDRGYPSEASVNGNWSLPQREPGAARLYGDILGRYFLIRVPDLSSIDLDIVPVYASTSYPPPPLRRKFVGTGSASNTSYIRRSPTSAPILYQQIINAVNRIKGASIRWMLLVDTKLTS